MFTDEPFDVSGQRALVLGASGNVGACVTRHLVAGAPMSASSSDRRTRRRGSTDSTSTSGSAMCSIRRKWRRPSPTVRSCTTAWSTPAELRDPAPLFATNVDGLQIVLEAASRAGPQRFVFLSTIGAVAIDTGAIDTGTVDTGRFVDEDTPFNWRAEGGSYIESRLQAEESVLSYVASHRLPAVIADVSNPYGPPDREPRQGLMVELAALGKMPFYLRGVGAEVVGIDDAAQAILRMS